MTEAEIISEFRNLRPSIHSISQGAARKMQRVRLLNDNNYDVGEERIRLEYLQPDLPNLRRQITEAITDIKKGVATGEDALELYFEVAREIKFAQATLDDIAVPKLRQVWAAEKQSAY